MRDTNAAKLCLLASYAEKMGPSIPAIYDKRMLPDWNPIGYIVGTDFLVEQFRMVCYGFVAESQTGDSFVCVVRGTEGVMEWIEDAEFELVPHPSGGMVEDGFYGVYKTLGLMQPAGPAELAAALAHISGDKPVKVIGHSLGAALATYLTYDLALQIGTRASGAFFASPRTGDADFVEAFERVVRDYTAHNYAPDVVPRVPLGLGYSALKRAQIIDPRTAEAVIRDSLDCNHHAIDYTALLDFSLCDWSTTALGAACVLEEKR